MANDDVQTQLLAVVRGGLGDNLSVISSQLELLPLSAASRSKRSGIIRRLLLLARICIGQAMPVRLRRRRRVPLALDSS